MDLKKIKLLTLSLVFMNLNFGFSAQNSTPTDSTSQSTPTSITPQRSAKLAPQASTVSPSQSIYLVNSPYTITDCINFGGTPFALPNNKGYICKFKGSSCKLVPVAQRKGNPKRSFKIYYDETGKKYTTTKLPLASSYPQSTNSCTAPSPITTISGTNYINTGKHDFSNTPVESVTYTYSNNTPSSGGASSLSVPANNMN
jgi:hypothetical protein